MTSNYTPIDIAASDKFAETNLKIRTMRKMFEKARHITSWLEYEIRDATHDDYYIPSTLADSCKIIDIKINKNLCDLLSCNPTKEKDTCIPNETASYYYVGDNSFDVQCQPSCYNIAAKITYNEDNSRAVDMPRLNYHNNKCRYVHSSISTWLEKPFYRSDIKYELRVNDMPTGFSRIPSDNPFGSGLQYTTNPAYCKYYDRTYNEEDGTCELTGWEKVADAVVGMQLINSAKSFIRSQTNHGVPFEVPTNLPELPSKLKPEHTVKGWKNNVNANFVMPKLVDTRPKLRKGGRSKREIYHSNSEIDEQIRIRRLAEETAINHSNFTRIQMGKRPNDEDSAKCHRNIANLIDSVHYKTDLMAQSLKEHARKKRSAETLDEPPPPSDGPADGKEDDEGIYKRTKDALYNTYARFIENLFTTKFVKQSAISYGVILTAQNIQPLFLKVSERLLVMLTSGLQTISGSIGARVMVAAIRGTTVRSCAQFALSVGARSAVIIGKVLGAAASVLGWIMVAATLLDLIFTIWDPYGYNNLYPPQFVRDMVEKAELSLRREAKAPSFNFEFDELASKILSEQEILEIQLESLIDRLIYLDALVVNSEGSVIDKGETVNTSTLSETDVRTTTQAAIVNRVKWSAESFDRYNDKFVDRTTVNRYGNIAATILGVITGFFFITNLKFIALIFLILSVCMMALTRLSLYTNLFVDLVHKYIHKYDVDGNRVGILTD